MTGKKGMASTLAVLAGAAFTVLTFADLSSASAHGTGGHQAGAPPAEPQATTRDEAPDPLANRFGGRFALTDHTGKRVTDESFRGKYMLVYFGFTNCADLCPVDMAAMAAALQKLKPETVEKIQPMFITVDPDIDTPQVLSTYVANFHPRLIGLTGSVAEVETAARAYRVHRHKLLHQASNGHPYIVDHGTLMFLMGPDGKFVTLFPNNSPPEKIATNLERYIK